MWYVQNQITNNWDISPLVTAKALLVSGTVYTRMEVHSVDFHPGVNRAWQLANISWMAEQIHMIELVLVSAYQKFLMIYDILYGDQYS